MARGGARQGKPGSQYSNRSDMRQAPSAAPGQQYGQAKEQLDAQQQIPLPATPPPSAPPMMGGGNPVAPIPLSEPTQRPDEPLTHGLPSGPGPGPEALNMPPTQDPVAEQLHALYQAAPNDDLLRLLQLRDQGYR